jgi:hypothetical protein
MKTSEVDPWPSGIAKYTPRPALAMHWLGLVFQAEINRNHVSKFWDNLLTRQGSIV